MTGRVQLKWMSPDSENNYKTLNAGGVPNYTKDEIIYDLNAEKYRCDDFDIISELPILFMGCSMTEGIGLPMNEVWSYHLHHKIQEVTNKKIPFWSLARGGTSIDYSARCFYEYAPRLKPKYVFYLMSGISRREYSLDGPGIHNWFPNPSKLYNPSEKFNLVSRIFSDADFACHQTHRSLMIFNSVAKLYGTKIYIIDIGNVDGIEKERKENLFSLFSQIDYVHVLPYSLDIQLPVAINARPNMARDNSHPGAAWQYKVYSYIWDRIKINFVQSNATEQFIDKKLSR